MSTRDTRNDATRDGRNPVEELAEEFAARLRRGERPTAEEYAARYPDLADEIRDLFPALLVLENCGPPVAAEDSALPVPDQLGGYRIDGVIGRGGMGVVYKGWHERMQRPVAIKVLPASGDRDAARRFLREVQASARLIHPHVVTAFDAGEADGIPYLVMEYVDGEDLGAAVRAHGPLAAAEAVEVLRQAAVGLAELHTHHILHRDVKPANLLRDRTGAVKVLDMGLSHLAATLPAGKREKAPGLTLDGQILGTTDYISPEQASDVRLADARSDVYSLGCTLFFLLTGRPPYSGDTLLDRITAHREAPVPSAREFAREVPEPLDRLCRRMMAKQPDARPASMEAVIEELDRALLPGAGREGRNTSRRRWRFAVLVVALAGGIGWALTGTTTNPGEPPPEISLTQSPETPPGFTLVRVFERPHDAPVLGVAVAPERRAVATVAEDDTVTIWNPANWERTASPPEGWASAFGLAYSPDGKYLAAGGFEVVSLWDVAGDGLKTLRDGLGGYVFTLAFAPDSSRLYAGTADYDGGNVGTVVGVELPSGREAVRFAGITQPVHGVLPLPDGRRVLVGGDNDLLGLWSATDGQPLRQFAGVPGHVHALALSPNGTRAVSGHEPDTRGGLLDDPVAGVILCWDVDTGEVVARLKGHRGKVHALAWSPDGRWVVSGSGGAWTADGYTRSVENSLRLWNAETGELVSAVNLEHSTKGIAVLPDGEHLLSVGGDDGVADVRLWRINFPQP